MVRVAVAGVDVLVVVLPRLRRPESGEERRGEGGTSCRASRRDWKPFALLNSSGRVSLPGGLVVVPLPLLLLVLVSCSGPDDVLRVRLQTQEREQKIKTKITLP